MIQRFFRITALWLALGSPALASQASLVTPGSPLPMASLALFLDNAFLSIGSCNAGTSAPANGTGGAAFAGECWINTTSNPWVFSYTPDGTHWVEFGTLNTSSFVWTPYFANNSLTLGELPQLNAGSFWANPTGSAANAEPVTLGSTFNWSGTTLNVTTCSATQLGACEPDGTTITASGGKLTAIGAEATSIAALTTSISGTFVSGDLIGSTSTGCSGSTPCLADSLIGVSGGGLVIAPTSGTTNQGIKITQTSPTSGSSAGIVAFNQINVTNDYNVTGTNNQAVGVFIAMTTGGSNQVGRSISAWVDQNHDVASSSGYDHIAFLAQEYTSVSDTSGGEEYGANTVAIAAAGADTPGLNGLETGTEVDSGATVTRRTGIRSVNQGAFQGSSIDAAYAIDSTTSGGSFGVGFLLDCHMGACPLASTGQLFYDGGNSQSVSNLFNFSSTTITNDILATPNVTLTGAGALTIANLFLTNTGTATASGYLCFSTTSHEVAFDSTTCGSSALRFKIPLDEIANRIALRAINSLPNHINVWRYKPDQGDDGVHVGLYADDVARMDERCAIYENGKVKNYEDRCMIAYLVGAVQALNQQEQERMQ